MTSPFVVLHFSQPGDPPIVYLESSTEELYLEAPDQVAWYDDAFTRLCAGAENERKSIALIRETRDRLGD